jgi:hypothetical protein
MTNAEDLHRILFKDEQDAVVADTEPEGAAHITVKCGDVARAGASKAQDAFKKTHGSGAVQSPDIGFGLFEPLDAVGRHLLRIFRREIFRFQTDLSKDVLHRNALAAPL